MLQKGCAINIADNDGVTALMLSCAEDTDQEQEASCVHYLLSHMADPKAVDNKASSSDELSVMTCGSAISQRYELKVPLTCVSCNVILFSFDAGLRCH